MVYDLAESTWFIHQGQAKNKNITCLAQLKKVARSGDIVCLRLIPGEGAAGLILIYPGLKEVLFLA
jgi:hypothetical protein